MGKTDDGGPAFPHPWLYEGKHRQGMSLRDWFAGMALAHLDGTMLDAIRNTGVRPTRTEVAGLAYQLADAMLAARKDAEDGKD